MLAERYAALGFREDAERELSALIADRHSRRALNALAELKLTTGQVEEAKPLVQAILEADAHDPAGLYLRGRMAFEERDLLQAASLFEEAIGRDATLVCPHVYLGLIRSTQGRLDQAEEELREATKRDPSHQTAHLALANLYLTQHKPAEAEQEISQTLRINPANLEAAVLYGDVFVFAKNWSKAEEVYGAIIRQLPSRPIGYVKMAALRKLQARPAAAGPRPAPGAAAAPVNLGELSGTCSVEDAAPARQVVAGLRCWWAGAGDEFQLGVPGLAGVQQQAAGFDGVGHAGQGTAHHGVVGEELVEAGDDADGGAG